MPAMDYGSLFSAMAAYNQAQAAQQAGQQQIDWAKGTYGQLYPYVEQGSKASLGAQQGAEGFAQGLQGFFGGTYQPVEQDFTKKALDWDTYANEMADAARAEETVASQYGQARQAALQQLEGFGVDPSSARYAALDIGARTQQAAAEAGAGNQAIQNRMMQGMQLENAAIQNGAKYLPAVTQAYGAVGNLGQSAASGLTGLFGAAGSTMGGAANYYNAAANDLGVAQKGFSSAYGSTQPTSGSSGLGTIGGTALALAPAAMKAAPAIIAALADGGPTDGQASGYTTALPGPYQGNVVPAEASPSAGANTDDVQARVNVGEFVIPKEVVQWEGEKTLYGLIDKAKKDRARVEAQTTAKLSALPALPGPPSFRSSGAALPA